MSIRIVRAQILTTEHILTTELTCESPPGWHPIPAGGELLLALECPRGDGDFASRLTFARDAGATSAPVETLGRALVDFRVVDEGTGTLAGAPAHWLVGRYLARGRVPVTVVRWAGSALVAVATIRSDEYDSVIDPITDCVNSVEFGQSAR